MSSFFIKFEDRSVPITGFLTIQELNKKVSSIFGVKLPGYSYLDEDSETIQVDIQLELNEAIRFLTETHGELLVEEKSTGTLQFIEELPLLRSQITVDEMKIDGDKIKENNVEESQVIQQIRSENSSCQSESFEELKETFNVLENLENFKDFEEKKGNFEEVLKEEKGEKGEGIEVGMVNLEGEKGNVLDEDEEFPEITFEKEESAVDLELIRSVIRNEILVSRSGKFVIHNRRCCKCNVEPIVGHMYKCVKCYYFVCENCEENSFHSHPLLKLKEPEITDKKTEMIERISKELGLIDKGKIKDALEKCHYEHETAVNYLLGLL